MRYLRFLATVGLLASSPALAVVSVTQNNVQVPTTGTLSPFDFLNDGTNSWPLIDLFDGTTHGTFDGDGGFLAHISNSSIAVTGTFWQATQPVSAASGSFASGALSAGSISSGAAVSGAFVAGSIADLAHGQGTMAASVPVAIASNQSAIPASESGTWNITNVSGTVSLPTGASTAALQPTNAAQGSTTSGQTGTLVMGAVTTSSPTYTTGQTSPLSTDTTGALRVNVTAGGGGGGTASSFGSAFPATGTAIGLTNGTNMVGWSAASNYGTGPGAIAVPAVNAAVTNTVAAALNTSPSLANGNGIVQTQGGSVLSATNGVYTNVLQGNAVLSATNPLFSNLSQGSAALSATNGIYSNVLQGNAALTAANGIPTAPSPYPAGSTPITASATGTTGATAATLTNVTAHTTYICGFSIRANATAAATGNATVAGTITGTLNFTQWTAPNASGIGVTEIPFAPCVPASAVSTSIVVTSAAAGTGGVVSVTAWGYSI